MDAAAIADKYITRDGRTPRASQARSVVWAPVEILDKEREWLTTAVLRNGYMPSPDRDGHSAPHLSEMRAMHQRGLVQGMPWRITKFGRECLREMEDKQVVAKSPEIIHQPPSPETNFPPVVVPLQKLAELERNAIESALAQLGGNKSAAARALGISVRTVRNKLRQYRRAG